MPKTLFSLAMPGVLRTIGNTETTEDTVLLLPGIHTRLIIHLYLSATLTILPKACLAVKRFQKEVSPGIAFFICKQYYHRHPAGLAAAATRRST
jgi:hypothetical protein